jgi:hypothetical protein
VATSSLATGKEIYSWMALIRGEDRRRGLLIG